MSEGADNDQDALADQLTETVEERDESVLEGQSAASGRAGDSATDSAAPEVREQPDLAPFQDLRDEGGADDGEEGSLDMILDIPVNLSVEIGRTRISIRNLLKLNQGSVVELTRLAGEPMDIFVNGTLIAHGEVVVVNEKFGIRLTDVISAAERVKKLK